MLDASVTTTSSSKSNPDNYVRTPSSPVSSVNKLNTGMTNYERLRRSLIIRLTVSFWIAYYFGRRRHCCYHHHLPYSYHCYYHHLESK